MKPPLADLALARIRQYCERKVPEAVAAHRDRHYRASQALGASILTAIVQDTLGYESFAQARGALATGWDDRTIRWFRFSVLAPLVIDALAEFWTSRGDPVPARFNRHASAHTLSSVQFTELNSLVALMLITSVVYELHTLRRDDVV